MAKKKQKISQGVYESHMPTPTVIIINPQKAQSFQEKKNLTIFIALVLASTSHRKPSADLLHKNSSFSLFWLHGPPVKQRHPQAVVAEPAPPSAATQAV